MILVGLIGGCAEAREIYTADGQRGYNRYATK